MIKTTNRLKKTGEQPIEEILALTPLQQGMFFHYLQDPLSDLYCVQLSLNLSGDIDFDLFQQSWDRVTQANEMLRTAFRWEKLASPVQVILKEHRLEPVYYDCTGKGAADTEKSLQAIKTADRNKKFDLRRVPFRVTLCKLSDDRYEMILSHHHILFDGWSTGILLKEFMQAYKELSKRSAGAESPTPLKTKFREFVKWLQRQEKENRHTRAREKFWSRYLSDMDTFPGLSIKKKKSNRAAGGTGEGTGAGGDMGEMGKYRTGFDKEAAGKLQDFVKNNRLTLASLLFTAWGLLLQRYSNGDDVIFGTTVSGRMAKIRDIEQMVGLFINTLPLRVNTRPPETILRLLHRIDDALRQREAFENTTALADLQEYLEGKNNQELFDSIVVLENYPLDGLGAQNNSLLAFNSYEIVERTHYDLTVGITQTAADAVMVDFNYRRDSFAEASIMRLADHFVCLIEEKILKNPGYRVAEISIITEEEIRRILYDFNNTGAEFPKDKTIHEFFAEQAEKTPDRTALAGLKLQVTRYRWQGKRCHAAFL